MDRAGMRWTKAAPILPCGGAKAGANAAAPPCTRGRGVVDALLAHAHAKHLPLDLQPLERADGEVGSLLRSVLKQRVPQGAARGIVVQLHGDEAAHEPVAKAVLNVLFRLLCCA